MNNAIKAYEKAFEEFKIARGIEPDDELIMHGNPMANAYYNKAKILLDLNRREEAFACQDKAIELDPNNTKYC